MNCANIDWWVLCVWVGLWVGGGGVGGGGGGPPCDSRLAIDRLLRPPPPLPLVCPSACKPCTCMRLTFHRLPPCLCSNKLFIACDTCKGKFSGCCCEGCMDAPRLLRPTKTKGTYGNWAEYASSSSEGEDPVGGDLGLAWGLGVLPWVPPFEKWGRHSDSWHGVPGEAATCVHYARCAPLCNSCACAHLHL